MGKHPTVTKSEMSELLDGLTVVTGGNFPAAYVRREVMGVARKALAMHHAEITTLRSQLAEAKADNARLREALESEPELPGDMPDEMWDALRHADRETMTEVLRACVRTTKAGILRAYTEGSK